jgi:hypothetical protein
VSEEGRNDLIILVGKSFEFVLILRSLYKFSNYNAFQDAVLIGSNPPAAGRVPFIPEKNSPVHIIECVSENMSYEQ